jgi:hypothetical protein
MAGYPTFEEVFNALDGPLDPSVCDDLFEVFLHIIDKPYDYNQLLVKLLCKLVQSTAGGDISFVDGVPMVFDPNRSKILSLARPPITAGWCAKNVVDRYLAMDQVPSKGAQGFYLPRKATITGIWAKSRSTGTWTVEARRNNVSLTLASTTITGGSGEASNIDIDMDEGDCLQIFASGSGISHPVAAVEIAWRS